MKKLALTSLLAMFAVSGAHAANIIDGNPLYRPMAGHFYSETSIYSHSEDTDAWWLGESFGYGITDQLSIGLVTALGENEGFDHSMWGPMAFGLNYRVLDQGAWVADVYGSYTVAPVWGDHRPFLDKDDTGYTWTAGVRGGYLGHGWTVAGHAAFAYNNAESFNWGDEGLMNHALILGLDGQVVIDPDWNLVAGVEYKGYTDDEAKNAGVWTGLFGVNYNIDATKYVGAYINTTVRHATGDWEFDDGFGFGMKFGIDF